MRLLRYCTILLCCALAMGAAQARYDQVEFFHLIERNDVSSTRKALAEGEFNANTFNHEGFSALYLALREPAPEVADILIEDPRTKLNLENAWGENALMMAALRGLLPQAIRMMELGAEVNKKGWAPLHYAASSGHLPMIKLLLDNYAYIDAQSPTGETPLMMAAARGTPAAVRMLLEAEADPNLKNKKRQTAIAMAMERGNTDTAKIIRDWLLRGGKPAPSPSPRPRAAGISSNALPLGAGSAPQATSSPSPSAESPQPVAQPTPEPSTSPDASLVSVSAEPSAAVEVQAVPDSGQTGAAPLMPEAEVLPAVTPQAAPTAMPEAVPEPKAQTDAAIEPEGKATPSPAAAPTPQPEAQSKPHALSAPTADQTAAPHPKPTPMPSVADIIAQPASRALLQILSPPVPPQQP